VLIALGIANKGVFSGVGSEMLGIAPAKESLDKFTRLFGISSFTECNRGDWTLDISEGCDTWLVDVAISVVLSPNALYRSGRSNESRLSLSQKLS
jgi:hypothetical protein